MHREPGVLEAEAQVEKWLGCRARTTSKELAPLHSVRNGILQNACATSPKIDASLEKSALMHIAGLKNSLAKGQSKKNGDKSAVAMLKLHMSGNGAAEVYNDFAEELKHTQTNPMCSIH